MRRAAALVAAALLAGCAEPDSWSFRSSPGRGTQPGLTVVAVWVSDAPLDAAESVEIGFDAVELDGPVGAVPLATGPRTLDLLALRNGRRALLAERAVAPGTYATLRLRLAGPHHVVVDGREEPLLPARAEAGVLTLDGPFRLRAGERLELQVDLDLARSVARVGDTWRLDPRATLVDARHGGRIAGHVLAAGPATVLAQRGGEVVATTRAAADGAFELGPLAPGEYDLVATAPGRAEAVERAVRVRAGGRTAGVALEPLPALPAPLAGEAPAGVPGLRVRIGRDGLWIAFAAVDPATGRWSVDGLASGRYEVEVLDGDRVVARAAAVTSGSRPADAAPRRAGPR